MAEEPQNSRNSVLCVPRVLLSYVSQTWGWRSQQHGNTNRHRQNPNKSLLSVAKGPGKWQPSKTETYSQPPLHSSQTPSSGLNGAGPQKDMSTPEPVIVILFGKRVFEDISIYLLWRYKLRTLRSSWIIWLGPKSKRNVLLRDQRREYPGGPGVS